MSTFAIDTYTGNGSTTSYSVTFPYITTADVIVTINGVTKTLTTDYTFSNSSTIAFGSAPANGEVIKITRSSNRNARLVDYQDGSTLTEASLDQDGNQAFFMAQEAIDITTNNISLSNSTDQWDANSKRITNVADPTSAQDVATKNYLENTFLTTANKTALTTVNANIANINAVNSNATNINSAVSNATNINTVATNIGSVNTVATDIAKVITVANDLAEAVSEVETVADDLNETSSEIEVVGGAITNVNTVGNNIANVNTVAGISSNVTTVAGISSDITTVRGINLAITNVSGISNDVSAVNSNSSNINTVAGNNSNISTVAGISGNVTTVAGISSDVTSVANDATDIGTVATDIANVNTVAGISGNVSTVAGVSSNVTTVAGISSDVTAVAGDATDIGTVATDLSGSNNIGTVAGAITNVNNVGGSIANVNTVAGNLSGVNSFGERYRVSSSAPGTSLDVGDLYFDTTANELKVYKSSGWANAGSTVNGTSQRFNYTATNGQTTFTGSDNNSNTLGYDAGFIDVYLNGSKLLNGTDVTVTSGTSVVLASGATTGDVVDIVTYGTFSVATLNADNLASGTVPDARITGAYTGITNLTMSGDLNVASNVLFVDASTSTVGLGTNSPNHKLELLGGSPAISIKSNNTTNGSSNIIFGDTDDDDIGKIFYEHGTNSFRFLTNANERMRIDSSGNVGIGTSSPTYPLQVYKATAGNIVRLGSARTLDISNSDNGVYLGAIWDRDINSAGGIHTWSIEGNERIRIDSSGNVGIGETAPLGKLHVKSADSGASVNSGHNQVIAENSGNSGMTILSGTSSNGAVLFGDSGNNAIGYINYTHNGDHLDFGVNNSEAMRIDSSGSVGIANTVMSSLDAEANNLVVGSGTGDEGITIYTGSSVGHHGSIFFADGTSGTATNRGQIRYEQNNEVMSFATASTERMRIDGSGRLLIGTTSTFGTNGTNSAINIPLNTTNSTSSPFPNGIIFRKQNFQGNNAVALDVEDFSGNRKGSIQFNESGTSFNTSSDYRLKENVVEITDATSRLKQLKPKRFNFIADADTTVDGFIAHEVSSIVPEAITGTKDAVETYTDDDGNEQTKPVYQGIDQSKLVPLLVKTIQELEARITTLENA